MDGDGLQDVLFHESKDSRLLVCYGMEGGVYSAPIQLLASSVEGFWYRDVNGDGLRDLLVENSASGLEVRFAVGGGAFELSQTLPNLPPRAVEVADVDGDGWLDMALAVGTADPTSDRAVLLKGTGTGTPFVLSFDGLVSPSALDVAVGDYDDDGDLDLVFSSGQGQAMRAYQADGAGNFAGPFAFGFVAGSSLGAFELEDLDGDGLLDVVVASSGGSAVVGVQVLFGTGFGGFAEPVRYTTPSSGSLELHDLDLDGVLDIVILSGAYAGVLRGSPDGSFAALESFFVGADSARFAVGDVDGDGAPDLAVSHGVNSFSDLETDQLTVHGNRTLDD